MFLHKTELLNSCFIHYLKILLGVWMSAKNNPVASRPNPANPWWSLGFPTVMWVVHSVILTFILFFCTLCLLLSAHFKQIHIHPFLATTVHTCSEHTVVLIFCGVSLCCTSVLPSLRPSAYFFLNFIFHISFHNETKKY